MNSVKYKLNRATFANKVYKTFIASLFSVELVFLMTTNLDEAGVQPFHGKQS
jgi:hypothetical protein